MKVVCTGVGEIDWVSAWRRVADSGAVMCECENVYKTAGHIAIQRRRGTVKCNDDRKSLPPENNIGRATHIKRKYKAATSRAESGGGGGEWLWRYWWPSTKWSRSPIAEYRPTTTQGMGESHNNRDGESGGGCEWLG